jgi:hypothetical protein
MSSHCTTKVCRDECKAEKEKPVDANKSGECCCSFYRVVVPTAADDEIRG